MIGPCLISSSIILFLVYATEPVQLFKQLGTTFYYYRAYPIRGYCYGKKSQHSGLLMMKVSLNEAAESIMQIMKDSIDKIDFNY